MKKIIIGLCLLPLSGFAQTKGNNPLDVIGFTPFSSQEAKTMWEEGSNVLGSQSECLKTQSIRNGGNLIGNGDETCLGGLNNANMGIFREPIASFMSSFGNPAYGYQGAGQSNVGQYNQPTLKHQKSKSTYPVAGLENLRCRFYAPHGMATSNAMDKEGFKREHLKTILTEKFNKSEYSAVKSKAAKGIDGPSFTYPKLDYNDSESSMGKIAEDACKDFQKEVGSGHSKFSKYTPGFGGHSVVVYSKKLASVSEALPYVIFSNQRVIMASQDLNQSNIGSSDNGADQLGREVSLPAYYDGNRGKNLVYGSSPVKMFQGDKEGKDGSAGIIAWHLCIEENGPREEYTPGKHKDPDTKPDDGSDFEFGHENTSILMPNNIVSAFPLAMKDGEIDEENTKIDYKVNPDKSIQINTNGPVQKYGPRKKALSEKEKQQMNDNASAMRMKVSSFVNNVFDNPRTKIDFSKTSLNVMSCANKLSNMSPHSDWKTKDGNKLSFKELSKYRSKAKGVVTKKMIEKEKDILLADVDKQLKMAKGTLAGLNERDNSYSVYQNKVKYLEDKVKKISSTDFSNLTVNTVDCSNDGSIGPDPYFNSLKEKYGSSASFPKSSDYPNKSAYYSALHGVSKKLKLKDVQDRKNKLIAQMKNLGDSEVDLLKRQQMKKWIKKYQDMEQGKDGSPGYINTPLLNRQLVGKDAKFPCDPTRPSENVNCNIVAENNKLLKDFKVENLSLNLDMSAVDVDEDIIKGFHSLPDNIIIPGEGHMYYAAVMCNRKYVEPKNKKSNKKCYSRMTGGEIPCPQGSSGGIRR